MSMTLDVSKLSGWLNASIYCQVTYMHMAKAKGGRGAGAVHAVCREDSIGHGGHGTRRAHRKHVAHVRDAGRVEAQWLVERIRGLEHVAHARDAGRVEAQWLVERRLYGAACRVRGGRVWGVCGASSVQAGFGWALQTRRVRGAPQTCYPCP
eukprot:scaffold139455_cov96-Phaeocystis_antarctica.AAC.1